jgi:copper resistance protein C
MRIVITTIALLLTATASAFAHAHLDHAVPKVGSTVGQAPKDVTLWFTEKLEQAFSSIDVRNEQGTAMNAGTATVAGDGTQLRVPLKALPPGTYKVIWRVLSVDTHRTEGNFTFHVGQ